MDDEITQKALKSLSVPINAYFFTLGVAMRPSKSAVQRADTVNACVSRLSLLYNYILAARVQFDSPLPEEDVFEYGIKAAVDYIAEAKSSRKPLEDSVATTIERSLAEVLRDSTVKSFGGMLKLARNYSPADA